MCTIYNSVYSLQQLPDNLYGTESFIHPRCMHKRGLQYTLSACLPGLNLLLQGSRVTRCYIIYVRVFHSKCKV